MTYEEFKENLEFHRTFIMIPDLYNMVINKTQFLTKTGYDFEAQEELLKGIYEDNKDRLSKQEE